LLEHQWKQENDKEREEWSKIFFLPKQQWKHKIKGRKKSQMAPTCLNNNESGERKGMEGERRGTWEKV
jgi:hypothetical protein